MTKRRWRTSCTAVGDIVKKQVALGVDVISDGELSKTSFQYYVTDRLSGLETSTEARRAGDARERAFPTFYKDGSHSARNRRAMPAPGR